jgi:hypothetical protein
MRPLAIMKLAVSGQLQEKKRIDMQTHSLVDFVLGSLVDHDRETPAVQPLLELIEPVPYETAGTNDNSLLDLRLGI